MEEKEPVVRSQEIKSGSWGKDGEHKDWHAHEQRGARRNAPLGKTEVND